MSDKTGIQWTDATWNPVTGCTKVSPGCKNCYAETHANRFWGERKFTDVRTHPDRLDRPLRWRKPRRVFVNSMSDLFHEDVPTDFQDRAFAIMALAKEHTFQVLTKRPRAMLRYINMKDPACLASASPEGYPCSSGYIEDCAWPLPNVWLGVSVEDQATANERIPILLQTPAAVRFLSVEPLLEAVHLEYEWLGKTLSHHDTVIDWVIVGGESGPHARLCNIEWIRNIVAECAAAGVPCFVKQLGSHPLRHLPADFVWFRRGGHTADPHGGDINEFPSDLKIREFPRGEQ